MGNALKLSRFGKVKKAFHGKRELSFSETQKVYQKLVIDLNDPNIQSLDTSFSISNGVIFLSLVEEKNNGLELPSFYQMAKDIKEMIDLVHRDGTLKNEVKKNPDHYLIKNPETVELLENLKRWKENSSYHELRILLHETPHGICV